LDELAAVANFSPFHFHRLFTAWCGETLGDYLRRRRVETAAQRLIGQPRLSVLETALDVGFGSGEAFSRAFRQHFGVSPSAWRQQRDRKIDQVHRKPSQAAAFDGDHHGGLYHSDEDATMNVTLIDREATPIAYMRYIGPFGLPVDEFWRTRMAPWMETNHLMGRPRYGISLDDPGITDRAKCRYDACVEAAPDEVLTGGALRATVPGGRYASMPFKGTAQEIVSAWNRLMTGWLPSSGLQLDARPYFEYYPSEASYDPATGVFECQLCIPVAPL
jgi:AraC family transcriptional regulator